MELLQAIDTVEASPDHRVLRRMPEPPNSGPAVRPSSQGNARLGLVVDVETTGLDCVSDKIIQFSALPFAFDRHSGMVLDVYTPLVAFEDPGVPIPEAVRTLTGITDDEVQGTSLPSAEIEALFDSAALVIAHNAGFDRGFVEARFPIARERYWGCSMKCIGWRDRGVNSVALDYVLYAHRGEFFDGHRADYDCMATLRILTEPFEDGSLPLLHILDSARNHTHRVWAIGSPFDRKDDLKARGYRWSPEPKKCWYCDCSQAEIEAELAWLKTEIYKNRESWEVESFNGLKRYSPGMGR